MSTKSLEFNEINDTLSKSDEMKNARKKKLPHKVNERNQGKFLRNIFSLFLWNSFFYSNSIASRKRKKGEQKT